jgi:hypothetical protein
MKRVLLIAVLLTAGVSTWGQTTGDDRNNGVTGWATTGNGLVAACQGEGSSVCLAYIHGALDGMATGEVAMHREMTTHLPNIPRRCDK